MQTNARRVQLSCITMNPWFVFYCNNLTFCVYCVTSNLIFCVFGFLFQDTVFIIKDRILCTVMSFLCKNENTTIKSVYGAKALPSVQFGGFFFSKTYLPTQICQIDGTQAGLPFCKRQRIFCLSKALLLVPVNNKI